MSKCQSLIAVDSRAAICGLGASSPAQRDEQVIATGFLALGVHDVNQRFKVRFIMDNVDEQIDTVSRAVLVALSRPITDAEKGLFHAFLERQSQQHTKIMPADQARRRQHLTSPSNMA